MAAATTTATTNKTAITTPNTTSCTPVWNIQPFYTSRELVSMFQVKGAVISEMMEAQILWRLQHPTLNANDCKSFLKETFGVSRLKE